MIDRLRQLIAAALLSISLSISPVKHQNITPTPSYNCYFAEMAHYVRNENECRTLVREYNSKYPSPTPIITSTSTSNDNLVLCNIDTHCGGGTKQLTEEECKSSTCCEVGNQWQLLQSSELCKQTQKEYYLKFASDLDIRMKNYEKTVQQNEVNEYKTTITENELEMSKMQNCQRLTKQYTACLEKENQLFEEYKRCLSSPLSFSCSKPSNSCLKPICL